MAIVKSKLLKQLSENYPNFLKKDLEKFTNIILSEIKRALKRGDRVELRGFGVFPTNILAFMVVCHSVVEMRLAFHAGDPGSIPGGNCFKISLTFLIKVTREKMVNSQS